MPALGQGWADVGVHEWQRGVEFLWNLFRR